MKTNGIATRTTVGLLLAILSFAGASRAQDKPPGAAENASSPVLKVQVILSEYDGAKKLSSLPYELLVFALGPNQNGPRSVLRMGVRVPVNTATVKDAPPSFSYMDVGTNIDCDAKTLEDGRYRLDINVERSSIYFTGGDTKSTELSSVQLSPGAPVVRQFRNSTSLVVRDGQKIDATLATDPVNGRVLKMEVTATLQK